MKSVARFSSGRSISRKSPPCGVLSSILVANNSSGRSISRILSMARTPLGDHLSGRRVTAPLGAAYPRLTQSPRERVRMKTSRLPPSSDGFVSAWPCSRRGLPGPPVLLQMPVVSYTTFSPSPRAYAGLFVSVALVRQVRSLRRLPAPGAIRRRALWSADFPRSRQRRTAIAQPT